MRDKTTYMYKQEQSVGGCNCKILWQYTRWTLERVVINVGEVTLSYSQDNIIQVFIMAVCQGPILEGGG